MITPSMIVEVMNQGVGFVCATCKHFWWAKDHGRDLCKANFDKKHCSGPLDGNFFPEYNGPLKGKLHKFCFMCGNESKYALEIPMGKHGLVRNIGVCEEHFEVIEQYSKIGEAPPFVTGNNLILGVKK